MRRYTIILTLEVSEEAAQGDEAELFEAQAREAFSAQGTARGWGLAHAEVDVTPYLVWWPS